jgi:hypothetical protein
MIYYVNGRWFSIAHVYLWLRTRPWEYDGCAW